MPDLGDPLGIIAAQSIGEPGTQLTMRTFHVGGTASAGNIQNYYEARHAGYLRLEAVPVMTSSGKYIIRKMAHAVILNDEEEELESFDLVAGAMLEKNSGEWIEEGERFVTWDPYNIPIISSVSGKVEFQGLLEGITYSRERSDTSGREELIVMEMHREDIHPTIKVVPAGMSGSDAKSAKKGGKSRKKAQSTIKIEEAGDFDLEANEYPLPANAHIVVENGSYVEAGDTLAKTPRQSTMTKDITGGLTRVAELFEARRPKKSAEIARISGMVEDIHSHGGRNGSSVVCIVDPEEVDPDKRIKEHRIPAGKQILVNKGDTVKKGQPLTDGDVVLEDMLEICGKPEMQSFLVNAVRQVYSAQGVEINDKHIEIIVRQMTRRVRITDPKGTDFLCGDTVDFRVLDEENSKAQAEGKEPAESATILQGITKAALATDSFISAASFQDTTRVLTEAATLGRKDELRGFKENVIMGHLIPAGTGYRDVQNVQLQFASDALLEEEPAKDKAAEEGEQDDLESVRSIMNL